MTHPLEEEIVDAYFAGVTPELQVHLEACVDCANLYRSICETLDGAAGKPVPYRGEDYVERVWERFEGSLPSSQPRWNLWVGLLAVAAAITMAFFGGMWAQQFWNAPVLVPVNPKISFNLPLVEERKPVTIRVHHSKVASPPLTEKVTRMSQTMPVSVEPMELVINPQARAVRVMEQMGSQSTRTLLATANPESLPAFRVAAVQMLAAQGDSGIIFSAIYRTDRNNKVRQAALDALAAQHDNASLLELARHETDVRGKNAILRRMEK
jgi:hypothetical protein